MANFKWQISNNKKNICFKIGNWGGQSKSEGARLRAKRDKGGEIGNFNVGFTLAELLITIAVFTTLVGIATINLVGAKQRASLNTSADVLIGDFRQQQMKSMIGDTEGRSAPDTYGVHFGSSEYTLFHGSTFNVVDSSNFTIQLGDNITFVSPPTDLIFTRVSGELSSGGSIVMRDNTTKSIRTLQYNRYGVITSVN